MRVDLQEQGRVNQNLQGQLDMKDKRIQELEQKNLESPLMETQNAKQIIQEIRAQLATKDERIQDLEHVLTFIKEVCSKCLRLNVDSKF